MVLMVYFIIILLATFIGAIAGLGGGVIIKPCLDLLNYHQAATISFYSSIAVFSMCIVSIYKQIKLGFSFEIKRIISISLGSIVGGLVGEQILNIFINSFSNEQVKRIQAVLLLIVLILIFIYTVNKNKFKHYQIENKILIFLVGLFLGSISIFLGIGGGPLNIALLMICFSYDLKMATVYSIATIFFSQISKLGKIFLTSQFLSFDLSFLPIIIAAGIIGGYIGTILNKKLSEKDINRLYLLLLILLMGISVINIL